MGQVCQTYLACECKTWERRLLCYASDPTRDDASDAHRLIVHEYFDIRLRIENLRPLGSEKEILDQLEKLCIVVEKIPDLNQHLTAVGMPSDHPLRPSTVRRCLIKRAPEVSSPAATARNQRRADRVEAAELSLVTIFNLEISRDDRLLIQWIKGNPASPVSQAYRMDGAGDKVLRICNQFTPSKRKRHLIYELVGLLEDGIGGDAIRHSFYAAKRMHDAAERKHDQTGNRDRRQVRGI